MALPRVARYDNAMDSVTLKNYRCFRDEQTARLAPLTLLVGENSTGKTSFLAILRALWDVAFANRVPDFREEPYDLGSFEDIAYSRGVGYTDAPDSFEAGVVQKHPRYRNDAVHYDATFKNYDGAPFPAKRRVHGKEAWIDADVDDKGVVRSQFGTQNKQWEIERPRYTSYDFHSDRLFPMVNHLVLRRFLADEVGPRYGGDNLTRDDLDKIRRLLASTRNYIWSGRPPNLRPFASAPVRSRPRRTYDPVRPSRDAEGEYIPAYLANMYRGDADEWLKLKASLEDFGQKSGLFDDIAIMPFGKTSGAPFRIQVRKWGKRRKGDYRNLIDVGYGVSQALPMLTELLRPDAPQMFLLQQPEVHLHPSAQAALGSLFCAVASQGRQLIVETHSDYIIDRVRMDVRDKTAGLKPDDVSILYFERGDLDVKIHSIRLDEMGNVLDAPPGYRQFFTDEMRRSVGF